MHALTLLATLAPQQSMECALQNLSPDSTDRASVKGIQELELPSFFRSSANTQFQISDNRIDCPHNSKL
jgi:hypothetical protein